MYVDKTLSGIKAVQTLSRLNRAHPKKHDACAQVYKEDLDEDEQVMFKGNAKVFVRTYAFLSSVLPYNNVEWEKRSIFLNFLIHKIPAPKEEDLSRGILDSIDMDSYRIEKRSVMSIMLPDDDGEIGPVPTAGGGGKPEPELDRLSNIIKSFNELFGTDFSDSDRVVDRIMQEIAPRVAADKAYQNAQKNSDKQNARIEHDNALMRVMVSAMKDDTKLFKQFMDNPAFKRWMTDTIFDLTYQKEAG